MGLSPGAKLGAYEIVAPLGAGGMGQVYRARDTRLGRDVAIKVVVPELAQNADARARFEREARVVASLSHPNIVTLFDVGTEGELFFVVLELLEGETLRARLSRSPMAWRDPVRIGLGVSEGLSAAHEKGLVHRDLKPENVFLTANGGVKILDFGLARRLPGTASSAAAPLDSSFPTQTGAVTDLGKVMGTIGYMSPEQARGEHVDAMSDLFSLGCVLYEMVSGHRPFSGRTGVETLSAILRDDPPPLGELGVECPAALSRLIERCLTKDPRGRFASARDLASELRAFERGEPAAHAWLRLPGRAVSAAGLAFLGLSIAGAIYFSRSFSSSGPDGPAIDSLAILPFVNASGNPEMDYVSEGIAESLINEFSELPDIRVVPRTTVFRYRDPGVDPRSVGRELRVQAVLTGRLTQRADRLAIQTDLIDVKEDAQLWGEQYTRPLADMLDVHAEIARAIAEKLKVRLTLEGKTRFGKGATEDAEAYQLYLKGRYNWNKFTSEGFARGIDYYKQAIEKDPTYARAYAGLANAYTTLGLFGVRPPREIMPLAKAAAAEGLRIDESLAEPHLSAGIVSLYYDWDAPAAGRHFQRALALAPHLADAHQFYAYYLAVQERLDEAINEMKRAEELDPLSLFVSADVGLLFAFEGQPEKCVEQVQKTLAIDPDHPRANSWLVLCYEIAGRYDEAVEHSRALALRRGDRARGDAIAAVYARSGHRGWLELQLRERTEAAKTRPVSPWDIAMFHARLGERDETFKWLEKCYDDRFAFLVQVKVEPFLKPLHSDPRFADLVRRVGVQSLDGLPSRN